MLRSPAPMSDRPRQAESLEVNEAEDGLVVYDARQDQVHHLNPSAAVIFDLCDGSRSVDEIAAVLADLYGLDAPPVTETQAGLDELATRGLIEPPARTAPESTE
jgi:PqqD family protein of HPr-rel-A system